MSADLDLETAALEAQRDQAWAAYADALDKRSPALADLPLARDVIEAAFNAGFSAGGKVIVDRWSNQLRNEALGSDDA